jgi:Mg2+ and Co2+ transporter CorA
MTENWGQNDPNYKKNLERAKEIQNQIILIRDLLKAKKDQNKELQKKDDPRLILKDFEEETQLKEYLKKFEEENDPFMIVNTSPELLN